MKQFFFILFVLAVIPQTTFSQILWSVYYTEGLFQECDTGGKSKGLVVCSFSEGKTDVQQFFYFPEDGNTQGTATLASRDGRGKLTVNFKNNRLEGVCQEYYGENPFIIASFKNGLLDGEEKGYLDGILISIMPYRNGKEHGTATNFYRNGQIRDIRSYTDGIFNGPFISYHENGQLSEKREYVNGKVHGEHLFYFENGEVQSVCHYNMGIPVKSCITYFPDKSVLTQEFYLENQDTSARYTPPPFSEILNHHPEGIPDGHWLSYYDNGQLAHSCTFSKGVPVGAWKSYNDDGSLEREEFYDALGNPTGTWKSYYNEDTVTSLTFGDNGMSQYWGYSYEHNGTVTTGSYRYGQKHGTWITIGALFGDTLSLENFSNGELHGKALQPVDYGNGGYATGTYDQGFKTGEWKTYDRDNQLVSVENFVIRDTNAGDPMRAEDNNRTGSTVEYYEDGKTKRTEGSYFESRKKGVWKEYHENGQLASVGEYAVVPGSNPFDPPKIGEWKEYHPNGTLASVGKYVLFKDPETDETISVKEGEWKKYHNNGQLQSAVIYNNGIPAGEIKTYYPDGKLSMLCTYVAVEEDSIRYQVIDGTLKSYYDNGQLAVLITYNKGFAEGAAKAYYPNGQVAQTLNYTVTIITDTLFEGPVVYAASVEDGEIYEYYEDGKLKTAGQFANGEKEGLWVSYYPNGKKETETRYKNDEPNGENVNYSEGGKILSKVMYQDGIITQNIQGEDPFYHTVMPEKLIFPKLMMLEIY